MIKNKIKKIIILCILPALLLSIALASIILKPISNVEAVIIGPIVGLDDIVGGGSSDTYQTDNSNATLSPDTPYTNGALRSYSALGIYNKEISKEWNGFKYASFIRFFKVRRTDGRPIYDDDGILDVSTDTNNLSSEVINYSSYIYAVETDLPIKSGAGFMWTNQQAKFSGTKLISTFVANGSGSDVSVGVATNPSDTTQTVVTIIDKDGKLTKENSNYMYIALSGTGQYENTFWGNTGGNVSVYADLTKFMSISARDWNNKLSVKTNNVNSSTYNGQVAYYSAKSFEVIASNLNNYIKVNDVKATPKYGTTVVPFSDGHHITISENGLTKIDIENGGENQYTTYYCFIDDGLPDVNYTYHNSNALTKRSVGSITTDTTGAKQQTISEGIFRDQVQVNFSYDSSTEAPEEATYTYNGKTFELKSGTWLSQEGDYIVTIKDLAGNTTISKFTIDKTSPNYNLNNLQNYKNYKVSNWYVVSIPYGYSNYGSYSFATLDEAKNFASDIERQNKVTTYELNSVDDFVYTNLIADDNQIKVGKYYYYKSVKNENLFVYYFDENSLNEAIEYYSNNFISQKQTYKLNTTLETNNYGNSLSESMYDNVINCDGINAYLINDYIFKYVDDNETYKIYYDYQSDNVEKWIEFSYKKSFTSQVSSHGLYKIKEIDYVGHETTYYVFLDLEAPILDIEANIYGKDKTIKQTISVADIPNDGNLIYYYEKFSITKILEDDKWWVLEIKYPDNTTKRFTYLDELPNLNENGSGVYTFNIGDRNANIFKFQVAILGKAPEVKFETINANSQLKVKIVQGDNIISDLKIFRNDVCLNSENGYDEFPNDDTNSLIYIDVDKMNYVFNKGGLYSVQIIDGFGRNLKFDFTFEKDIPTGILTGVDNNGKTNSKVEFSYNSNKYLIVVTQNENTYESEKVVNGNITTLTFMPIEESEYIYKIQLLDKLDTENYNIYSFTIKTIKPIIYLFGVEPNGTTGGNVYATWNSGDEIFTATYSFDDKQLEYRKGQNLTIDGKYLITVKDELGNENSVSFSIDKSINFSIEDVNGNKFRVEEIEYINFNIKIVANEPLNITVEKDDKNIDYDFGLFLEVEGFYSIILNDEFNNSYFFTFTIDKTPPKATLYGVEEFGKTRNSAWITSQESNLICWYITDENVRIDYTLGKEIIENGKYIVYVSDRANNFITFEFEIDKEISFDINTYRGGISNGGVRIIAYENLKIVMYKDDNLFDYEFEQILNDDGIYSFTIVDDYGNKYYSYFEIITKKKQNLQHKIEDDIEIIDVIKDGENYDFQLTENGLYLYDEGSYKVNIKDRLNSNDYSFEVTIDTTAPTLELVNVENGGVTKKVVTLKNVSEKPYNLYITVDGIQFEYKLGDEIEKCGRFIVTLSDEAGNTTVYTFEREYSLNGPSIAILAGLGVLVILFIILLVRSRKNYYKEEFTEEEIEETTIEDDSQNDESLEDKIDTEDKQNK